ncbi:hypothetical protein MNKW57_16400 [Biformimicrobium ophioploci]|uniref:Uncharacterized protein n=1 Tax=Biformimicrobium ophioploci TaxID=3036711 RepID=A0ABQ6LZ24_9GAMM|nr:hypothetical protein MNKW57_16400 [Microbulbifer sp. NKW57]
MGGEDFQDLLSFALGWAVVKGQGNQFLLALYPGDYFTEELERGASAGLQEAKGHKEHRKKQYGGADNYLLDH